MSATMTGHIVEEERFTSAGADVVSDYRRRRALEESERAELKRMDLEAQCSPLNSADLRIRAWEKLHRLSIPSDPDHPVLAAIAVATLLTLSEVRHEQQLRSARRASAAV